MKSMPPILILSLFLLLVGCSSSIDFKIDYGKKNPVNFNSLLERKGIYYEINSEKPFSGSIIDKHESGQYSIKGSIKKGYFDGDLTKWYENGQIGYVGTFKDGKEISRKVWNKDGSVKEG